MAVEVIAKVIKWTNVTSTQKLVLLVIAEKCQADGTGAWPSVATIAREACLTDRAVQKTIKDLVEMGAMRVVECQAPGHSNHLSNQYSIVLDYGVVNVVHQGGEPRSPGVVNNVHQGGEPRSPNPLINRPESVKAEEGANLPKAAAPEPEPKPAAAAFNAPEIDFWTGVTGQFTIPGSRQKNREEIIQDIRAYLFQNPDYQEAIKKARPFYMAWKERGYNPGNPGWFDWALVGAIPRGKNESRWPAPQKPRELNPEIVAALRETKRKAQEEQNASVVN